MKGARWKFEVAAMILAFIAGPFLPAAAAGASDKNLLLITIDTLRPDRLSCYNSNYVKTPAVDALASRGVLFENAFAHASITLASHVDILLGTTPLYHGVSENSKTKVPDVFLTLAEHLKASGYSTGAFVGAFPLDSRFGLTRGFDVYDDHYPTHSAYESSYSERIAERVISPAVDWLSRQTGKWFCWIHLWDPHAPYLPPEPYLTQYKNDPYSGEAAYVDAQLGILFEELRKRGWTEKTLIVLTADHGESLGEHGELTHSYFAYNSTIHVPMIMAGPKIKPARIRDFVSHIDIFPTACEFLSVKTPAGLQGESLASLMKGKKSAARPIYFEALESYLNKGCAPLRGFIEGSMKYMESPIPELYDLAKDFDEKTNLSEKTDLKPYKKKMQDLEKSWSSPRRAAVSRVADRETLDRLRSLGYIASPVAQTKSSYGPEDDLKSFLPFQQKLELAIQLADQNKKEESIQTLKDLIAQRKDFTPAYTTLAGTYLSLDRNREALQTLQDGSRNNPKNYTLLSSYGTMLVKFGQNDAALEVLGKALAILDFDPEVWDNLGIAHLGKGEFEKALEYFEKAIALDNHFALAFANMGAASYALYFQTRRSAYFTACLEYFKKSAELDPTLNSAWKGLGHAYWSDLKTDQAIAAWEKAVATDATDSDSVLNLGQAYLEKGDKARALKYFQRYLELKGNRIPAEKRNEILSLIDKCK